MTLKTKTVWTSISPIDLDATISLKPIDTRAAALWDVIDTDSIDQSDSVQLHSDLESVIRSNHDYSEAGIVSAATWLFNLVTSSNGAYFRFSDGTETHLIKGVDSLLQQVRSGQIIVAYGRDVLMSDQFIVDYKKI